MEHPVSVTTVSRRKAKQLEEQSGERSAISSLDRAQPRVRWTLRIVHILAIAALLVTGIGPLLWLAKAALSTTQDTISAPFAWFPSGIHWENIPAAWGSLQVGKYLTNTAIMAAGSTITSMVVIATLAYVLSILRPKWAPLVSGAVLVTLFIPGVISLVPLYLTIVSVPVVGGSLLNSYWAIWLPAAANAFGVLVVKRFFDDIPHETIEAARVDGAGSVRIFFQIVLPFSKSILGVLAVLTVLNSWKDFLWPMLVLPNGSLQPISVALARLASKTDLSLQMAAMFLGLLIPIVVFLLFQRQILRGVSMSGATKG